MGNIFHTLQVVEENHDDMVVVYSCFTNFHIISLPLRDNDVGTSFPLRTKLHSIETTIWEREREARTRYFDNRHRRISEHLYTPLSRDSPQYTVPDDHSGSSVDAVLPKSNILFEDA